MPHTPAETVTPALVAALDRAWRAIRARHPDVPEVVLTLGSGTEAGRPRHGHYAPGCWQRGPDQLPELFVSGEGLTRGPRGVLSTVLHEAAHGVADTRGIHDTSRQGRWHNTRFRALAEELGLTVEKVDGTGWSKTTVPEATARVYASELQALQAAITAYRHTPIRPATGGRASNNNGQPATCPCGRRIRASPTVFQQGSILCGLCGTPFQP